MASSIETSKFSSHFRSISLPCRSHPLTTTVEEHLSRLRSSEAVSSSSSSSASKILGELKSLYDCIDDLLQLPLTQQALSHLRSPAEESLDGSLQLLDACGNVREAFSQMKECVQELKSSFRRRKRGDSSFAYEVEAYINSRKKLTKVISKYLRNLKKKGPNKGSPDEATLSILREAGEISLSVFQSLLRFFALASASSKPRGWSLVSKLLEAKRVSCDGGEETNEVQGLDATVLSLRSSKDIINQIGDLSKRLDALELSIQEIEEDLECIFRRLVKLRVSLLNIVNH
ncbi:uncharacterized protein LOC115738727 [Rhodamnia argentea]|uniref:Uncharacterized protein LOC115738727 n=1 Tax=Rhodamnia argentea TaxID=178133 RepID=A0A8B8P047_9MYRT|nr:uncharacterized protein LOC115738727 [Rhodamnia argentea]